MKPNVFRKGQHLLFDPLYSSCAMRTWRKKSFYPEIVVNITLLISLTQESESLTFTPWKTYMMDSSRNVKTWILSKRGTVSSVLKTQLITYELHNCTRWTWLLIQTDIYWELWLLTYMTACWHNYLYRRIFTGNPDY